jgi:tetratricopeptide (TPR) repeat protein
MSRAVPLIALLLCVSSLAQTPKTSTIQQSDKLFSYGEDPPRDRQALDLLEQASRSEPGQYQILWRLARANYYVAEETPKNQKLPLYERGAAVAQQAISFEPNAAEGHFWLGANYGGTAELKGMFNALFLIGKIRSEMETVVRLNPGYEDARAYLALSELDRQLPRLIGGSTSRAVNWGEEGLKLAPRNLELKLSLARAYLEVGRREDARRQLQEIAAATVSPVRAKSERAVQQQASQLLTKV